MLKSRGSLLCTQRYVSIFQLLKKKGQRKSQKTDFVLIMFRMSSLSWGSFSTFSLHGVGNRHG